MREAWPILETTPTYFPLLLGSALLLKLHMAGPYGPVWRSGSLKHRMIGTGVKARSNMICLGPVDLGGSLSTTFLFLCLVSSFGGVKMAVG